MVCAGGYHIMHIPPYYKRKGFQYFFVGIILGSIISYLFFLYINGELTERWIEQNVELRNDITNLENQINGLLQDKEDLNKENKEKLTVQEIQVEIVNSEKLKLDRFIVHDLTSQMSNELSPIIGKSIQSLSENKSLIKSTIENKSFKAGEFSYQPTITLLVIATKLQISVEVNMASTSNF
jgi:hypothetical protein